MVYRRHGHTNGHLLCRSIIIKQRHTMKEWNERCPKCGGTRLQLMDNDYLTDTYKHRCMDCEYTFRTTTIQVIVEGDAITSIQKKVNALKEEVANGISSR